jgi:D-alanyl-D-alanine carboxypeptidase (penicillin-binding protein 5/6)
MPPPDSRLPDFPPVSPPAAPRKPLTPPVLHAASAILVDAVSGQVLYARNADLPRPMASTTKIMTALLFVENTRDSDSVTASNYACTTHESSLHLKPGEKLTAHDLLCAILMRSANDACVVAAEKVAGSEAAFVEQMNARAAAIGATHTHFTNPHGLHDPDHYTTARDLALIARAAMQEPRIAAVVGTRACVIKRSMNSKDVHLTNHSRFLGHFPGADGVKTGWTVPAGKCYVGSATWGRWRLLSVVLKSPDYVRETALLMKYGFLNFEPHVVARAGDAAGFCPVQDGLRPFVSMNVRNGVQVVTRKGETPQIELRREVSPVSAPIAVGQTVGSLAACVHDRVLSSSPLVATEASSHTPVAALSAHRSRPWNGFLFGATILATGLVSLRYGTRYGTRFAALAKSARRRRRRLAKSLRGDDYFG